MKNTGWALLKLFGLCKKYSFLYPEEDQTICIYLVEASAQYQPNPLTPTMRGSWIYNMVIAWYACVYVCML